MKLNWAQSLFQFKSFLLNRPNGFSTEPENNEPMNVAKS